jgi:ferritin
VTGLIHQLYGLAVHERDYSSQALLQGFVTEQVEEEKTATEIVHTLRMIVDNNVALLMYDRELAQRQAGDGGVP